MGEQPIYTTKAHVFQIDPSTKKKWLPASSQAINVSYYYDSTRKTYRIISVDGSKAVINSTISPNMTFTKTSQKFGQWSDPRAGTVYGLGFATEADLTKFIEKFKEVKEMTRQHQGSTSSDATDSPPVSRAAVTNGNTETTNHVVPSSHSDVVRNSSPLNSPKPAAHTNLNDSIVSMGERRSGGSVNLNASLPAGSTLVDQLKYENDRLKIALAQSSSNAKKWEVELQTLKNNNVRLTTALQESTANVEEWKKQLAAYKEESARMKKRVMEMESSGGGSELLQRQLVDMRDKMAQSEKLAEQKQEEVDALAKRLNNVSVMEESNRHLEDRIKGLEREKAALQRTVEELKQQQDQARVSVVREKQQVRALQEQIGAKIGELYEVNDKLADLLQTQSHS